MARRLDEELRAEARSTPVAGFAVAVVYREQPVLVQAYGLADVASKAPMHADQIFRIGSVTKTFTAAAILKLEERGLLKLTDPLSKFFPEFRGRTAITLEQLLTHTSGIPNYTDEPSLGQRMTEARNQGERIAAFASAPLVFPPGSRFAYSNSGYYLVGLVIEKVAGQSYEQFVHNELVAPAGLADTRYCPDAQDYPRAAPGYARSNGALTAAAPATMSGPYAAGALCSTASDLARWFVALSRGKVVTPATFARMSERPRLPSGELSPYGLGLFNAELDGHARVGHHGEINGFVSAVHYYPKDNLVVAVLVNTEGDAASDIATMIERTVFESSAQRR